MNHKTFFINHRTFLMNHKTLFVKGKLSCQNLTFSMNKIANIIRVIHK